jgi:hypothetical protein
VTVAFERQSAWGWLFVISIALAFCFFVGGVYVSVHVEEKIQKAHRGPYTNADCTQTLPKYLCRTNIILSCILLLLASVLIFHTGGLTQTEPRQERAVVSGVG